MSINLAFAMPSTMCSTIITTFSEKIKIKYIKALRIEVLRRCSENFSGVQDIPGEKTFDTTHTSMKNMKKTIAYFVQMLQTKVFFI